MAPSHPAAPELTAIAVHGTTREQFLVRATLAAGAAYGTLSATPLISRALAESGDVDILNYALTLEYLEAEFYRQGLRQVKGLSGDERKLATEIRDNEDAHVGALAATVKDLGGTAAKKPTLDFGGAFASRATFLETANTLEDAGVSAYNGAAPLISSKDVLAAAGGIVQVEARHAALIRLARGKPPAPRGFDKASDMDAILKKVAPFIKS